MYIFKSPCDGTVMRSNATKHMKLYKLAVVLESCLSMKISIDSLEPIYAAKAVAEMRAKTSFGLDLFFKWNSDERIQWVRI